MDAGCLVQSDSINPQGLISIDSAVLTAGMICSSGGKLNRSAGNFTPAATTDCPVLPDPLSARIAPTIGSCSQTNLVVSGSAMTLQPGVYCGGLTITNGATVKLADGIFIIKDGPLTVEAGATLTGSASAIFMSGPGSTLLFDADTTVDLSAPKDGPLSGILIYDDPAASIAKANVPKSGRGAIGRAVGTKRQHQILSDNARNLLGTIYAPQAQVIIDALKPIADKSAYTVLVVDCSHFILGPNLVLNTNYSASDVPVAHGVGPYGSKVFLAN